MTRCSIRSLISLSCGGVLVLAACDTRLNRAESAIVRDSAGVKITETAGDIWSIVQARQLSDEPAIRIGAAEGDEPYLFDGIRGIVGLSDGRVVVANSGSATLRWFDAEGRFLFERGGSGGGPGEFRHLGGITRSAGDTIIAVDWSAQKAVVFTADGTHATTKTLSGLPGPPGSVFRLSDGSFITSVSGGFSSTQLGPNPEPGPVRVPVPLVRIPLDGANVDTLGNFLGMEILVQARGRGFSFGPRPFGKDLHYTVADDRLYVGTADHFVIDVYSTQGALVRSIRAPDVDLRLTEEMMDAFRDQRRSALANMPADQRAEAERSIAALVFPELRPAYRTLLVDVDGKLWVGEHLSDPAKPRRWAVFDGDGQFIELVETLPRFVPYEITRTLIWGRATDDLGVQYVVAYALGPTEGAPTSDARR